MIKATIRAAFTTQEQVYLSWPVLQMSLYTVNSSLNRSVTALCYSIATTAGGCHAILVRCCTGVERRLEVTSAHAQ